MICSFVNFAYKLMSAKSKIDYPVCTSTSEHYLQVRTGTPMILQHYHNILGSYYGEDVELDDSDMTTLLQSATGLICVADYLQSMKAISKAIDNKLLSQGPVLYRSIANSPVLWMNTAYSIKSEVILREALIHLVGNWNAIDDNMKILIHPDMQNICKVKVEEVVNLKRVANSQILGQYPEHIQREPESAEIGRASYSNDIMTWMALAVYRQYVGQAIARGLTIEARDGGFDFYQKLNIGGQAYLDRFMVRQFHYRFPMSSKGQVVIENHLSDLKEMMKPFIQELVCNRSQLDVSKHQVPYLTCLKVEKSDIPWIRDRLQAKTTKVQNAI